MLIKSYGDPKWMAIAVLQQNKTVEKQVRVCVTPFLKQQLDLFRDYESEEIGIGRFPLRTVCVHGSSWILAVSGTLSLPLWAVLQQWQLS